MAEFEFIIGEKCYLAELKQAAENTVIKVGDTEFSFKELSPGHYEATCDGKTESIAAVKYRGKYLSDIDALVYDVSGSRSEEFVADSSVHAGVHANIYVLLPCNTAMRSL